MHEKKCFRMRSALLEKIYFLNEDMDKSTTTLRSLFESNLFDYADGATNEFNIKIRELISALLKIKFQSAYYVECLSAILDESLTDQAKMHEINKINKAIVKSRENIARLSQNLTDDFQKIKLQRINQKRNLTL